MPAHDRHHVAARTALIKDGWTITHDPYRLKLRGGRNLFVDLGADRLIAADRGVEHIAVEVKSFLGPSDMQDLEGALGQYVLYLHLLKEQEPRRTLYLAVPERTRATLFEEHVGQILIQGVGMRLMSFDPEEEVIVRWTP